MGKPTAMKASGSPTAAKGSNASKLAWDLRTVPMAGAGCATHRDRHRCRFRCTCRTGIDSGLPRCRNALVEAVSAETDVKLCAGQSKGFGGCRFVEVCVVQRLGDQAAFDGFQIAPP